MRTSKRPQLPRIALVLAVIAFVLMAAGITLTYLEGGRLRYSYFFFALSLLAFIVWFWGRTRRD